jgi:hypothetical protein
MISSLVFLSQITCLPRDVPYYPRRTAGIVTGAAAIMDCVFAGMAATSSSV